MIQTSQPYDVVFESAGAGSAAEVTVAVSLYNYEQYVPCALQSVYDQTLAALDVIVVEDCSRDGSLETARRCMERMQARFHRTCLVRHTANLGLAAARNTAFRLAATPLVFVLDADNVLYPRCLERLHEALRHSSAALAYSLIERMGDETGLMGTLAWDPAIFTQDNYIDAMVMLRRAEWEAAGGYAALEHPGWEDFDLWCTLAERGRWGVQVPEILARYRVHRASMMQTIGLRLENVAAGHDELRCRHPWLGKEEGGRMKGEG